MKPTKRIEKKTPQISWTKSIAMFNVDFYTRLSNKWKKFLCREKTKVVVILAIKFAEINE